MFRSAHTRAEHTAERKATHGTQTRLVQLPWLAELLARIELIVARLPQPGIVVAQLAQLGVALARVPLALELRLAAVGVQGTTKKRGACVAPLEQPSE